MIKHQIEPKNIFFQFLNKIIWQFINKILGFMQINASISPKTIFKKIRKIARKFPKIKLNRTTIFLIFQHFFPKSKAPKKKKSFKKKKRGKCDGQSEQVRRDFCWCSAPCICGPSFRVWGPGSKAFNHLRSGKEMIEPTWRLFFLFLKKKEEKQSFSFSSNFSVRQHGAGTSLKEKVERSRFQSGNMAAQTEIFGCETKRSGNELCSWLG